MAGLCQYIYLGNRENEKLERIMAGEDNLSLRSAMANSAAQPVADAGSCPGGHHVQDGEAEGGKDIVGEAVGTERVASHPQIYLRVSIMGGCDRYPCRDAPGQEHVLPNLIPSAGTAANDSFITIISC
ncbi:hypothetical protein CDL15_Pgr022743 [Punica granatum]|uniref:Uncharacterized protein n=1 Tax=Punica granatum TaxID=22663 RepID=A0A218XS32_PUNGR|nr:hypothetical protein CDL15_Pgr022743 [Punica granatum]PKI63711.1 hypothetical protein CRG98_015901 [Punica granatum]